MSWLDDPDLQLFFKECRLSGYVVSSRLATTNPDKYGVAVGGEFPNSAIAIMYSEGRWRVWRDVKVGEKIHETLEEAIEDMEERLKGLD